MSEENSFQVSKLIKKFNRLSGNEHKSDRESQSDDRAELLNRLRLSRDELDAYIRHTKKVLGEKKDLELENNEMKTRLDVFALRIQRLEKQEQTLTKECNDLLKMVCEFCPQGVWDPDAIQGAENRVISSLKNSIFTMLEDRHLHSVVEGKLEEELASKGAELALTQNIITELNAELDRLRDKINQLTSQASESQSLSSPTNSLKSVRHLSTEIISSQPHPAHPIEDAEEHYNVEEIVESMNEVLANLNLKINSFNNNLQIKINNSDQAAKIGILPSVEMNDTIMNCETYWKKFCSFLILPIDQFTGLITNMSSKIIELENENQLCIKEVKSLKYALSCRIELQNLRLNAQNPQPCKCKGEIDMLKEQIKKLSDELTEKTNELQESEDNRSTLLDLLAGMARGDD